MHIYINSPVLTQNFRKSLQPRETLGIVAGQELPRRGRCGHYGKSYRWFRFVDPTLLYYDIQYNYIHYIALCLCLCLYKLYLRLTSYLDSVVVLRCFLVTSMFNLSSTLMAIDIPSSVSCFFFLFLFLFLAIYTPSSSSNDYFLL